MMRRISVLFALLCVFAFSFAANAEVLLWLVNTPVSGKDFAGNTDVGITWDTAVLRATTLTTASYSDVANAAIYDGTGAPREEASPAHDGYGPGNPIDASTGVMVQSYVGSTAGRYVVSQTTFANASGSDVAADLESLVALGLDKTALSFYVELYEGSTLVGYSSAMAYSDLENFRNDSNFYSDWASYSAWNPNNWTAVPEPTSGMLALLGLVALGLRRRRV